LSAFYEDRRLIFVFGAMRDKAISEISEILFPLADNVIATMAQNPRSATTDEIRNAAIRTQADIEGSSDVAAALDRAQTLAANRNVRPTRGVQDDGVVVVTGSIYVVGEAMRALGVRADAK
jgi:dihydrofolate synthase/folylpolyglutamate synthase